MDGPVPCSNDSPSALQSPPKSLTDGTVTLRHWRPSDAPGFCHVINSSRAEFVEWFPWASKPHEIEDAVAFMERKAQRWNEGQTWSFAITFEHDKDTVIGSCDLGLWEGNPGGVNMGYWLATEYLGHGYATRAAALLVRTAFEDMGAEFERVVHDVANERSARIPQRLGFERGAEFQSAIGEENPENRPDSQWFKYAQQAADDEASGGV